MTTATTTYTPSETVLSLARAHRETGEWVPIQDALSDDEAPLDLWELSRENVSAAVSCVLALERMRVCPECLGICPDKTTAPECFDDSGRHINSCKRCHGSAVGNITEALRAIHEARKNDYCRMLYADLIEPSGPQLAEFVRVQCELARHEAARIVSGKSGWKTLKLRNRAEWLRRRERELLDRFASDWLGALGLYGWSCQNMPESVQPGSPRVTFRRGLVAEVECTWADWLRIERAVYWHPEQRGNCGACVIRYGDDEMYHPIRKSCPRCHGTGTVPRPFSATAQPLEEVRITDGESNERDAGTIKTIDWSTGTREYYRWPGLRFRFAGQMQLEPMAPTAMLQNGIAPHDSWPIDQPNRTR